MIKFMNISIYAIYMYVYICIYIYILHIIYIMLDIIYITSDIIVSLLLISFLNTFFRTHIF